MILGLGDVLTALAVLATLGVCLTVRWDWLSTVNDAGIPHVVPTVLAVLLAVVACMVRSRAGIVFRFLACYWALGAVCFARPALMGLGVDIRLEPLIGAMAVVLVAADRIRPSSRPIRRALLTAAGLPIVVVVVAFLPPSSWLGAVTYGLIAAVALLSLSAVQSGESLAWKST